MKRCLPFLFTLLLIGCGGSHESRDGSVSLFFSDETEGFGPSTIGFADFDKLRGSDEDEDEDEVVVQLESNGRFLEVVVHGDDLRTGSQVDLASNLDSSVYLEDPFGKADGVEGRIVVERKSNSRIDLRFYDVVLVDEDGEGEATLDGTLTFKPRRVTIPRQAPKRSPQTARS